MVKREPFQAYAPAFLQIEKWKAIAPNVTAGISTRIGGVSPSPYHELNTGFHVNDREEHVIENRERLAKTLDSSLSDWVNVYQVHGKNIVEVTEEDRGKGTRDPHTVLADADGMYTKAAGVYLAAGFADCTPLFFVAPSHHLIGVAHAGWKGTVAQIGPEMVRIWHEKHGVPLNEIYAVIGPAIGKCCYEVDNRVMEQVRALPFDKTNPPFIEKENGKAQLDLKQLNMQLLEHAGIPTANLECSTYCTSCESDKFFSHRRDNGKTGRMLGVITQTE
ncbi:peptidoglycan editing factor PgeF [Bacillus tianshenii]|nr:peptidoglycan editing factor PgeF [Bacillus tianshenii]